MTFDDDGYEWHEATDLGDRANGRRVFLRGRRTDRAAELADGIRELISETVGLDGSLVPRQQVVEKLRALL